MSTISKQYDASIDSFRSFMDRFIGQKGDRWRYKDTVLGMRRLGNETRHYREVWAFNLDSVNSEGNLGPAVGYATLFVSQQNHLLFIDFYDGKWFGPDPRRLSHAIHLATGRAVGNIDDNSRESRFHKATPIGQPLQEVAETLIEEFEAILSNQPRIAAPVELEKTSSGSLPTWWPRQQAKKNRWKSFYRKIKPLFLEGLTNSEISQKTGIRRQEITHIIQWGDNSPDAHDK